MRTAAERVSDLVRIPSVSCLSNRQIVNYAFEVLRQAHWSVRETPYLDPAGVEKINLIAAPQGQNVDQAEVDLAFVCHTDTVPAAETWLRAHDPFVLDGLLHGCGACDVKGFLACLLTAIDSIDPIDPAKFIPGLRLVLTADEEIGCIGADHLLKSDLLRPRRVVIGEPTSLHPARAGKGYHLAEVTVTGQEAHSALPKEGFSAIYGAARMVTAMEECAARLAQQQHTFFTPSFTTLNVGKIEGGTAKNIIAGRCTFLVEWRPLPGKSVDASNAVFEALNTTANQLRQGEPRLRCDVKLLRQQEGFETAATSELVRSIEALTGRRATSIPFGSEASLFASVAGEVVVFGPGDMRTAHSDRECVPVAELEQAVECLRTLMVSRSI